MSLLRPLRFRSTLALLAFLLLPPLAGAQSPASRPVVLILHGRGVQDADSTGLRRQWLDALNRGLVGIGSTAVLEQDDVRLVWYADALDPRVPAACAEARSTTATDPIATALGTVGTLIGMVADISGEHEGAALRSLAGDLLYLGDERKRCAAEERLADALARATSEHRPVLLVAHSFGSLVAYHHLQTRDTTAAPGVERLITVGSLIGRPELRELLLGADARGAALPPRVGSWVNVHDPEDPFAAPLLGLPSEGRASGRVRDQSTERANGRDPHDAARYLSDPTTARAVLESWCAALPALAAPAAGCPP